MTPVKYKCAAKNLTSTFAGLKIVLTEKLTNGALVTPTPDRVTVLPYPEHPRVENLPVETGGGWGWDGVGMGGSGAFGCRRCLWSCWSCLQAGASPYITAGGSFSKSGPWFNMKMPSYQYRKSHCGDKTVVRSSYLHNGNSYTGKMASLCCRYVVEQLCHLTLMHNAYDLTGCIRFGAHKPIWVS